MVKKAFILGAGLGTRLRPLTFIRPKPLVPVLGKPLIEYAIRHLKTVGINHIIINTHHLPEQYLVKIGSGENFGLDISYSYEPKLLDTGGGLKNIESFIGNETFIMYNGDIITDIDLSKMIKFHKKRKALATLLVSKRHLPLHLWMDKDNKITDLGAHLADSKKDTGSLYAFCGIHILEPEISKYIPPSKPISIITVYQELIKRGLPIMGYPLGNASWEEIGDIDSYKKIHKNLPTDKTSIITKELTPNGSKRKFFRIEFNGDSIIVMHYGHKKVENTYYANILLFLKNLGINVPKLIYKDSSSNALFLEDLGNKTLYSVCRTEINEETKIELYQKALDQIIKLHLKGKKSYQKKPFPISQFFNYKLYRWESSYFEENCLINYFRLSLEKEEKTKLYKDFRSLAQRLSREKMCLIHRDFQSKNIMVKNGQIYLIDFQGMRFGLPHYDLASLLYDPYVTLSPQMRNNLYSYYVENIERQQKNSPESIINLNNFIEAYRYSAIQRLMQALGAYGYLGLKLEKREFLSYIPQAIKNLRLVLKEVDGLDRLKKLITRLMSHVTGNTSQKI